MHSAFRAKMILERLHSVKNNSQFEITALFHLLFGEEKKRVNFEIGIIFDWMESFLFCLCSSLVYILKKGVTILSIARANNISNYRSGKKDRSKVVFLKVRDRPIQEGGLFD